MSDEKREPEKVHANVVFGGGNLVAVTGIIGGVVLALGFPWIVLAYGQALGPTLLVVFIISGLSAGGLVALVSAFFGLVIPREVGGGAPPWWISELKSWRKEWKDWGDVDWKNWTEQEWKDWVEKKKKED
jgi:hypothetical protein